MRPYTLPFSSLGRHQVAEVGGKNSSLGEMIANLARLGVSVPDGFATTADAYRDFLAHEGLADRIKQELAPLDVDDVAKLAATGARIRDWIMSTPFPPRLQEEIVSGYRRMAGDRDDVAVAVRSSATAEDLPEASFAGQQETFLNVRGAEHVVRAVHEVFASLFNDRAISYRVHQGFDHSLVALSAGVQYMVRSDLGASGVMFTLDTDSGFRDVVFITASYGLGETVVQGAVNPDEFYVYKPALRDGHQPILRRTLGAKAIKMVYAPAAQAEKRVLTVDVPEADRSRFCLSRRRPHRTARSRRSSSRTITAARWTSSGARTARPASCTSLQARPETVQSRAGRTIERYSLKQKGTVLASGRSIGQRIGAGPARVIKDIREMARVETGDVLVADMTDPDWEPVMKRASAIVTNRGGRTCHAAIIARELGIPAVVGCGDATRKIKEGQPVTVSCAEGDTGYIYDGQLEFSQSQIELDSLPDLPVKIMMNVGNPDRAFDFAAIPNTGVGLARLEFIINRMIGVHPKALLEFDKLEPDLRDTIRRADGRLRRPGRVLRRQALRRHRHDRGRVRARARHRAPVRLQVERVREPDRRPQVRAHRGKPDDRVPRRVALRRRRFPSVLRARVPRSEARARADGSQQRLGHGAVRAHAEGSRTGRRAARGQRPEARRERPQDHHDVRDPVERGARRSVPRVSSTACRSARTT